MRRAGLIPSLCFCSSRGSLAAQWQANVDLGVFATRANWNTRVERADDRGERERVVLRVVRLDRKLARRARERRARDVTGARRGIGSSASFTARVQWELGGITSVFAETKAQTASSAEVLARGYYGQPRFGSSLAIGGGTRRADAGRQPLGARDRERLDDNVTGRIRRRGVARAHDDDAVRAENRITLTYTDASASWRGDFGRVAGGAIFGVRTSNNAIVPDGGWGSADVHGVDDVASRSRRFTRSIAARTSSVAFRAFAM
jgi:hypothetical protein